MHAGRDSPWVRSAMQSTNWWSWTDSMADALTELGAVEWSAELQELSLEDPSPVRSSRVMPRGGNRVEAPDREPA